MDNNGNERGRTFEFVDPNTNKPMTVPESRVWIGKDGVREILPEGEDIKDRMTVLNAIKVGENVLSAIGVISEVAKKDSAVMEKELKEMVWVLDWDDPAALAFAIQFAGFERTGRPDDEYVKYRNEYRDHVNINLDQVRKDFHKQNVKRFVRGTMEKIMTGEVGPKTDQERYQRDDQLLYSKDFDGFWAAMKLATQVDEVDKNGKFIFWGSRDENGLPDDQGYQNVRNRLAGDGVDVEWLDRIRQSFLKVNEKGAVEFYDGRRNGKTTVI